jgi:hypothetical protein
MQLTGDYMPTRNITFRLEYNHRWASVPYWSGPGGITPPGGNNGNPAAPVMINGSQWNPDLQQTEDRISVAMMIRY